MTNTDNLRQKMTEFNVRVSRTDFGIDYPFVSAVKVQAANYTDAIPIAIEEFQRRFCKGSTEGTYETYLLKF